MTPKAAYDQRIQFHDGNIARLAAQDARIAFARVGVFLLGVAAAWASWQGVLEGVWVWLPVGLYVVLMVVHERVLKALGKARFASLMYGKAIQRMSSVWAGKGNPGARFEDPKHPYAADLDVFGEGSLFELLCTARTGVGEEVLAHWLKTPATRADILARQEAVKELAPMLPLKEDIALLGSEARNALESHAMAVFLGGKAQRVPVLLRVALASLGVATLVVVMMAISGGLPWWSAAVALGAQSWASSRFKDRVEALLANAPQARHDLRVLSTILARVEAGQFTSPLLTQLQSSLGAHGSGAPKNIARLATVLDWVDVRRNQLLAPFAWMLGWGMQGAFLVEDWKARHAANAPSWVKVVGTFEALLSLSTFHFEHPEHPFPTLLETGPVVRGDDLGHPLIAEFRCVRNSLSLGGEQQLVLVSGSNMSGKSTYLRTIGANVVLALAGAPVVARSMELSVVNIGATLRIQDSLQAGKSRFYAEITRLKQVVDLARGPTPLLFLLDEILHGTNSHDRRQGAEAVLKGLMELGAVGVCTTHDLALAQAAEALAPRAINKHFEDDMREGVMVFTYRIQPGVVQKSNALELMRAVGLNV